jgi:hypothetical protein
VTWAQSPSDELRSHASHLPVQRPVQQTPSTHIWEVHSPSVAQVDPLGLVPHEPPTQLLPEEHSTEVAGVHVAKQLVPVALQR